MLSLIAARKAMRDRRKDALCAMLALDRNCCEGRRIYPGSIRCMTRLR